MSIRRPIRPSTKAAKTAAAKLQEEPKARVILELSPTTIRHLRARAILAGHRTTKAYVIALLKADGVEVAE